MKYIVLAIIVLQAASVPILQGHKPWYADPHDFSRRQLDSDSESLERRQLEWYNGPLVRRQLDSDNESLERRQPLSDGEEDLPDLDNESLERRQLEWYNGPLVRRQPDSDNESLERRQLEWYNGPLVRRQLDWYDGQAPSDNDGKGSDDGLP